MSFNQILYLLFLYQIINQTAINYFIIFINMVIKNTINCPVMLYSLLSCINFHNSTNPIETTHCI